MTVSSLEAASAGLRVTLGNFLRGDYARGFFVRIASQAAAVIVLIEAIFLAEHFTWVFRDAVRHEADLSGIGLILACTSTEIFDLALAVAILMAAYMTLLRMRENREILVLFASGLGPYQLGVLVLMVALAGQVISTIGSGVADPMSRYAQRSILFSSELRSLKKGVAKNEFYYFPSYVAYAMERVEGGAPPPTAPGEVPVIDASGGKPAAAGKDRTLFVYQQTGPNTSRVVTAAQARLELFQRESASTLWQSNRPQGYGPEDEVLPPRHEQNPAEQSYVAALAMATLARHQMLIERQLNNRSGRGDEQGADPYAPSTAVDDPQATLLAQAVRRVALAAQERTRRNEYGGVYNGLYRQFGIASYRRMPPARLHEALEWLERWRGDLMGEPEPPPDIE